MTKNILMIAGLLAAGTMAGEARAAQGGAGAGSDPCLIEGGAAVGSDRIKFTADKALLAAQRTRLADRLSKLRAAIQPDERAIQAVREQIELNAIALANVEAVLSLLTTLKTSLEECEAANRRLKLTQTIAGLQADDADRRSVEEAEKKSIAAKLAAAMKARDELNSARSLTESYTRLASRAESSMPAPAASSMPVRQAANGAAADDRPDPTDCDLMIDAPTPTAWIGRCAGSVRVRSASLAGGDVAFPSSVLRPRGITANLTGGSSDGTLSISYADTFGYRRTPGLLPVPDEQFVQRNWEWGYSFGLSAKDGIIFKRDDPDTSITDNLDGKATGKIGFFFNVFEGETLKDWQTAAATLSEGAVKACRKDQASGESKTPSTCQGQSLTDWVYAIDEKGTLRRPDLANQANALYFNAKADQPKWGGGVDFSFSRGNFKYLDPAVFIANPDAEAVPDGDWSHAATLYGFWRMTKSSARFGLSAVPSISYSSRFGYADGTEKQQFCRALTAGVPFVTEGCASYYVDPPERLETWTPALEMRLLTKAKGPVPPLGISPKISLVRVDGSTADRNEFALPILAFIESEPGLGVGLQYSRKWGGVSDTAEPDGSFEDLPAEDSLKIVVSKTFSLSGK